MDIKRLAKIAMSVTLALTIATTSVSCHRNGGSGKGRREYIKSTRDKKGKKDKQQGSDLSGIKIEKGDNRKLYEAAERWLGTPYRYGGHSHDGTDCSGMVMEMYKEVYGVDLERNSAEQFNKNCHKLGKDKLREGDLVFFATGKNRDRINHVGIYLKDRYFVHASSSRGVIISSLEEEYWERHYVASGRVKGR